MSFARQGKPDGCPGSKAHHVDNIAAEIQAQFKYPLLVIPGFMGAMKQSGDHSLRRKSFQDFMHSSEVAAEFSEMAVIAEGVEPWVSVVV